MGNPGWPINASYYKPQSFQFENPNNGAVPNKNSILFYWEISILKIWIQSFENGRGPFLNDENLFIFLQKKKC